jgi:hypothetical protein
MSSEAGFWASVQLKLAPFGSLHRVENRCELGMPDVHYLLRVPRTAPAVAGWLENKELAPPARARTPLRIPSLTLEQVRWHEAYAGAGGLVFTLLRFGSAYALLGPTATRSVFERQILASDLPKVARVWETGAFPVPRMLRALVGLSPL